MVSGAGLGQKRPGVKAVMAGRIELAKTKGCSGVEVDNVDGYGNNTGFPLTQTNSAECLNFLAGEAHARGLMIGIKKSPDLVPRVHSNFDFAVVEQCALYNECAMYQLFIDHDKAIF